MLEEMRALIDFIERREKGSVLREIAERRLKTLDNDRFRLSRDSVDPKPQTNHHNLDFSTSFEQRFYQILPKAHY